VAAKEEQGKEKKGAEEKAPAKSKSGRKRLFIIGGIVLLAAVAIAVAVILYMRSSSDEGETAEGGEKKAAAAIKATIMYPLEPFIVNIHDGSNLRYLKVKLEFEIPAIGAKEELDRVQAPMRDAILVLLSSKNLDDISMTDGKNKLRDEVMATLVKVAPAGKVSRVYFTDFVVQ